QQTSAALRGRGGEVIARGRSCSRRTADVLDGGGDRETAAVQNSCGRIGHASLGQVGSGDGCLGRRSLAVVALVCFWDHEGVVGAGKQEIGSACRARTDRHCHSGACGGTRGFPGRRSSDLQQTSAALRGRGGEV